MSYNIKIHIKLICKLKRGLILLKMNGLVERAKRKDSEAYALLVKEVEADLMKIAMNKLKNYEDAQDIVLETLYTGFVCIDKLRDNDKFKPWIIGILKIKCKKFCSKRRYFEEISDDIEDKTEYNIEDKVDFNNILDKLSKRDGEVFRLYFEEELTTKQISERLNINENTLKTILKRGKQNLEKKGIKRFTILVWIFCIFIATSVIAISIISYVMGLFETNSIGVDNAGIIEAIENNSWFQEVDMDYINLGNGYKIRVEYLLMDEMNLYIVYDLQSENDISEYEDMFMPDLKIVDESGNVICDKGNISAEQYSKKLAVKNIEDDTHNMKELVYMFTDSFPKSRTLHISFSKVALTKKLERDTIDCKNTEFDIELDEKFVNRDYVTYVADSDEIEKAIVTETGFYAIVKTDNFKLPEVELIDNNGTIYEGYSAYLNNNNETKEKRNIIIVNFDNTEDKELKLKIDNKTYELKEKE